MDSNNLEDLGIYQDGDKSVADSVPIEDFSLNISTDDELEQNVFENSDVTFDEDDISIAGQSLPDVGSLTEFEEIEQKIRRNRVAVDDSDDNTDDNTDISDIPTDMENKNRKESQTASSAASSRQPSFEQKNRPTIEQRENNNNTIIRRPSSSVTSTSPPSPATLPTSTVGGSKLKGRQLQDTGYQSAVGTGSPINKVQPQPQRQISPPSGLPPRDQRSSPSSNDGIRSNTSSNDLTAVSTDIGISDQLVADRRDMNESGEPNSMVATFGTTEDFERLLKQQLVDDESNEQYEPFHLQSESSSDNEKEKTKENSPPPKPISKPSPKERTSKLPVKSSRLSSTLPSSKNKSPPQKPIKLKTNPATRKSSLKGGKLDNNKNHVRSPAANRARNARNMRSAISPLTRESSGDDLSVRSDASSSELKYRLRNERKTGKEQAELLKHLQGNYSDLLMKFADAENTIDKLRLGAKIDLAVSLPQAHDDLSLPSHQASVKRTDSNVSATTASSDRTNRSSRPSSATTSSLLRHSQSNPQLSTPNKNTAPAETLESSLKLPMSAKSELYKIGLRYQAKDLQNKIDSLATLLHETDLPRDERESAMKNVEDAMTSLQDDYDSAVEKHENEKHQLALTHGIDRVQREIPDFDQGGTMDKEIKGLGDMVKALRDTISRINAQEADWENEKKKQQEKRIKPNHQIPKDKKKELEEKFKQLLNKHNNSNNNNNVPPEDDGHTTATSIPYLPSEDDVTLRSERAVPNIYMAPADSFNDDSLFTASQTSQSTVISSPYSARRPKLPARSSSINSSFTSVTSATPSSKQIPTTPIPTTMKPTTTTPPSRSPSRIPRLMSTPIKKKLIVTNAPPDKGTDSGFVGSESSRQSIPSPMTSSRQSTRSKPTTAADVTMTSPSSKQPTTSSVTSSKRSSRPTEKRRTRKPETTTTTKKQATTNRKPVILPKDDSTADDVSTTSTIRGLMDTRDTQPSVTSSDASTVRRRVSKEKKQPLDGASAKGGDDSALQTIRGEIERLRDEIKKQQARQVEEEKERQKKEDEEKERQAEQEKKAKREKEERERKEKEEREKEEKEKKKADEEVFRPLRVSTPVSNGSTNSDSETLRIIKDDIKALKNEMRRQSRPGRHSRRRLSTTDSDTSVATSVIYQPRDGATLRRSRSLTRGESQANFPPSQPQLVHVAPQPVGYWTYVPDAPVWTTAPMGRRYVPKVMSSPTSPPPPVYGTKNLSLLGASTQPSKPNLSVFISPRSHGGAVDGDVIKKADVYIVDPSFSQQQMRRSSSMTRLNNNYDDDVIMMDPALVMTSSSSRLNSSLDRAVRSAQKLRDKTRRIYAAVRDDVNRSQLFAETF